MYPFQTDKKEFITQKTTNEVKEYLEKNISPKKLLQRTSDQKFYGKVRIDSTVFQLGQYPTKNAWRPIVRLKWYKCEYGTKIISSYSLNKFALIFYSVLPFCGLSISSTDNFFFPFIFSLLLYLILVFGIFQLLYMKSKKNTDIILTKMLKKLYST